MKQLKILKTTGEDRWLIVLEEGTGLEQQSAVGRSPRSVHRGGPSFNNPTETQSNVKRRDGRTHRALKGHERLVF
jgi:hypothetical protein